MYPSVCFDTCRSLGDMTDQEARVVLSEAASAAASERNASSGMDVVTSSCSEHGACGYVAAVTVSDSSSVKSGSIEETVSFVCTPVAGISGAEYNRIVPTLADMENSRSVHSDKCQPTAIDLPALYAAPCQETPFASAQKTVSTESTLQVSSSTNASVVDAAADVCNLLSNQKSDSQRDSQNADSASRKAASSVEETVKHSAGNELPSSLSRTAVPMDQAKTPTVVSTSETPSLKMLTSVIQSSHSARQVKCRKTGHRRITANGANLSLGQLINAMSESCLTDGLDPAYIPNASLSSHSNAVEHKMLTPVKAADAADSCAVKENLSRRFDSESVRSAAGSPASSSTSDAQRSPQVVDGVRKPPRARKSCQSNDLPKEPPAPAGSSFGTVCLAELVDAQSLDKLAGRSFDELLLAKMREHMRPSNGFKLLMNNSEYSMTHAAAAADEAASENSNKSLDSGMPLIPSATREKQVVYRSSAKPTSLTGDAGRKHVWRCRKSNSSPSSKVVGVVKQSEEKLSDSVVKSDDQTTRRSPRYVKRSPSWQHSEGVNSLSCLLYTSPSPRD